MIRNTIWVQRNISSELHFQLRSMHIYLGVHLTCFHSNYLRHDSEFSLRQFQYLDIEKNTQNKQQYNAFIDPLTLVMDSQQSTWNCQSISRNNHELFLSFPLDLMTRWNHLWPTTQIWSWICNIVIDWWKGHLFVNNL